MIFFGLYIFDKYFSSGNIWNYDKKYDDYLGKNHEIAYFQIYAANLLFQISYRFYIDTIADIKEF